MTAKELYEYALDKATAMVNQADTDELVLATPCSDWNVQELLGHMLYELAWAADVVAGKTMEQVGNAYEGDLLGDDFRRSWRMYELATRQSVQAASPGATVHLSYGSTSLNEYLMEAANDELIHAWDLGQAIGIELMFDEQVARALYDRARQRIDDITASGLFASPVAVPDSAGTQAKLLALLGRSEDWRSP